MTVLLPSGLGPFTGFGDADERRVEVEAEDVAGVVRGLGERLPGLEGHLLDGAGALRPHLLCLVDGTATRDLATPVHDRVRFLTAVSGG